MEFLRRTDGRTDRLAGGRPSLSSRMRAPDAGFVFVTLLICRQPDSSNLLRIFCLSHILSFIISFFSSFSSFSRRLYTLPLFLPTCFCPAIGMDFCLCRVPAQGLQDTTFVSQRGSNPLCQFCCCSGLSSHLYAWPPCSTCSNLCRNKFCLTSQFLSEVYLSALQID